MADVDDTYTSILLPQSRVAMYAHDPQSVEAFKSLQSDWRFTRVSLDQYEGGVEQATADLQAGKVAPSLLIIETDTIDDSFTAKLETLAGYCPEGTAAIVIGPVNDVNLYRKLIAMGISDYLVRPVKAETLSFDIARSLIERIGATGSRLVALVGAKGGVGTTSLAQAMAWGAADLLGQKTVLLDGAGGWSTLNVGMNFEPGTTLAEAARAAASQNEDAFKRMLHQASDKLQVLSSGGDVMLEDGVNADSYEILLDKLMATNPLVIVDLSHSPTALRRIVLSRAHQITLVSTPLLAPLRSARSLLQEIKNIRADSESRVDLVINKAGMAAKQEISKVDLESALDRKPSLIIEYNDSLFMGAEGEGRKLNATSEGQGVVRSLLPLMLKILDGVTDSSGIANDAKQKNPLSDILGKLKVKK